jgi:hypothetical protein
MDLPPEFAAWWWRPQSKHAGARSLVAQRCAPHESKRADNGFGVVKDWCWYALALLTPEQRLYSAGLYAALLAPQAPALPERLARLDPSDRQWGLAIGSIQPLPRLLDWAAFKDTQIDLLGYAELGFWINAEFPALWARLLEDLDESSRDQVLNLMKSFPACDERPSSTRDRVKRCWGLALNRTENRHGIHRHETSTS